MKITYGQLCNYRVSATETCPAIVTKENKDGSFNVTAFRDGHLAHPLSNVSVDTDKKGRTVGCLTELDTWD